MMSLEQQRALVIKVARLNGINVEDADLYVAMSGDVPEIVEGVWQVRNEDGQVVVRLKYPGVE